MLKRLLIASILIPAAALGQQWKLIAPMHHARVGNILVFLNDGRLLAAGGGSNSSTEEPTSETYDSNTDTWTLVGNLNTPRGNTPYAMLNDGRVLISGGWINNSSTTLSSTEIFDPVTNKWSYSIPLNQNREAHMEATLPNGKVLIGTGAIGGTTTYFTSCELFDPVNQTMQFTGSVSQAQFACYMRIDSASGNAILFAGHEYGAGGIWYNETEEYNAATGIWNVVAHSQAPHNFPLRLPNGEFILPSGSSGPVVPPLVGTQATPLIEIYNPRTKQWRTIGNLPIPRYGHGVAYIGGDSVLVGGGIDPITGKALNDCEIINLRTGIITSGPPLNFNRAMDFITQEFQDPKDPCTVITKVYAIGGIGTLSGSVDVYDSTLSTCEMIEFRRGAPSVLSLPQPVFYSGTVCNGIDTSITITAITCNNLRIDSVRLERFSNSLLTTKLPDTLANGALKTLQLSLHSTNAGTSQGSIKIFYNLGGVELDTSIAITITLQPSTGGTIRSVVHDISDAGDTAYIPVYLVSNSGDAAQGIQFTTQYNTDLLSPIDPDFRGTIMENAQVWDQNQISGGMNFFAQQPFNISTSKPLVILKFKTYVTKEQCTSFIIDNLQLSFDSTGGKSDPCPLAVIGDSATICRAIACGEPTLRDFLGGKLPELRAVYDAPTDKIIIDYSGGSTQIEIINFLGEVVKIMNTSGTGKSYCSAATLPSGIYIIRSSDGTRTITQKIAIVR